MQQSRVPPAVVFVPPVFSVEFVFPVPLVLLEELLLPPPPPQAESIKIIVNRGVIIDLFMFKSLSVKVNILFFLLKRLG